MSYINDDNRVKFSIKFKEPTINHEKKNPFIYPEKIKELDYFYDIGYTTRYSKYVKIINYETLKEILIIFKSKNQVESKFLEDYEDSSKLKENKTDEFLGSFRLSLSKKKEMFFRTYPDVAFIIGGYISTLFSIAGIFYFILVRYIDNIRIFDSIQKEDRKELSLLIIKDDEENDALKKIDNEICCCCCQCCYNNKVEVEDIFLIETNYNVEISCKEKWHYYFYKLTRNCCKQKDNSKKDNKDNSNKSCREKTKDCFVDCLVCLVNCLVLIIDAFLSVFIFCGGCDTYACCNCLGIFFCCCCRKDEEKNDNKPCCKIIGEIFEGIFCCCRSDNVNNRKLRRIDEYLEQYSDAENYFELIINKENKKVKKINEMDSISDYSNY